MHMKRSIMCLAAAVLVASICSPASAQAAFPDGQITGFGYSYQMRMWADWVGSDINGDGWRDVLICGAIYMQCFDVNPAHDGPKLLWSQTKLHHEVFWGCDSGIDVNGDGITEQLAFEAVWNNHYLIYGNNGTAVPTASGNDRRYNLHWSPTNCGTGLNGTDVNGNGVADYVVTGIENYMPTPVLMCIEGKNGSVIWTKTLAGNPSGVRLVTANNTLHILTWGTANQLWHVNGSSSGTLPSGQVCIIPDGASHGNDMAIIGNGAYNVSSWKIALWTTSISIGNMLPSGDVDGDGIGDYGGLQPGGTSVSIVRGSNGTLIRNHSAQDLLNVMHGVIGVGDIDHDGRADYGIFGDFALAEVFSGRTGQAILQMKIGQGVEEMYPVPDVNGNGEIGRAHV
jgi:hypothetical protein